MPNHESRDANMRLLLTIPRLLALVDEIREEYSRILDGARQHIPRTEEKPESSAEVPHAR
jgi:hypothetical protein